jgi:hypothetical protein
MVHLAPQTLAAEVVVRVRTQAAIRVTAEMAAPALLS